MNSNISQHLNLRPNHYCKGQFLGSHDLLTGSDWLIINEWLSFPFVFNLLTDNRGWWLACQTTAHSSTLSCYFLSSSYMSLSGCVSLSQSWDSKPILANPWTLVKSFTLLRVVTHVYNDLAFSRRMIGHFYDYFFSKTIMK